MTWSRWTGAQTSASQSKTVFQQQEGTTFNPKFFLGVVSHVLPGPLWVPLSSSHSLDVSLSSGTPRELQDGSPKLQKLRLNTSNNPPVTVPPADLCKY